VRDAERLDGILQCRRSSALAGEGRTSALPGQESGKPGMDREMRGGHVARGHIAPDLPGTDPSGVCPRKFLSCRIEL
jgi:hypothetical protein